MSFSQDTVVVPRCLPKEPLCEMIWEWIDYGHLRAKLHSPRGPQQSNAKSSPRRRSLRTVKVGTGGSTQLFGFVDVFADTEIDDAVSSDALVDFGVDGALADSSNDATVDPAGATDSAFGRTEGVLLFGARSEGLSLGDAESDATAEAEGSIVATHSNVAESEISPAMVIPGTVANATTTTKGTKGTKSTGGDGAASAVPGVELVGAANGTQAVVGSATLFGQSETEADDDLAFTSAQTISFVNASGDSVQDSVSAAGPIQDGSSQLLLDAFGFTNASSAGEDANDADAIGDLFVNGSAMGSGFATFDNTTAAP